MAKSKLTTRQQELIAQLYRTGNHSMNALARTYDVSRRTIGRVLWHKGLTGATSNPGLSSVDLETLNIVHRYRKEGLLWSTSMNDELIALFNMRGTRAA